MHPALRWTLWIVGTLLGLVVLAVAGALVWLSTPGGRETVLAQVEPLVPGLEIEGAEGGLFDLGVARLTLADREGVWLTVEGARLDWSPLDLLTGTVQVDALTAGRVAVARAPVSDPDPEPETDAGPFSLPVAVDVDRLALERVELGAALLGGTPALLTAGGQGSLPAGRLGGSVDLRVERIDESPGTAALRATYVPGTSLDLDLRLAEPAGGVLARLLEIPGRPPVDVAVTGEGPLTDWTGRLEASAGDVASATGEARIRPTGDAFAFGLDLSGNVAALAPDTVGALLGRTVTVAAGGLLRPGERIALDGFTVTTAAGTLAGQGVYDIASDALNAGLIFSAGAESALHTVLTEPVFGNAQLAARIEGPAAGPAIVARLTADDPAWGQFGAETLVLDATVEPQDGFDRLAVTATAMLQGATAGDARLAPLLAPRTILSAGGMVETAEGVVRLDRLSLDAPALDATGSATLRGWGTEAEAALRLTADSLAPLSGLAGTDLSGALAATAGITRRNGVLTAEIDATGRKLATGIAAADALLGPETKLAGRIVSDDALRVPALSLKTGRLAASGTARLEAGRLTAETKATLADLAPLGAALGTPLAGSVQLTARIAGPTEALDLEATGSAADLAVQGRRYGEATLELSATGLPAAPEGTLSARTQVEGEPARLSGRFALAGDSLRLSDLDLRVAENSVTGDVVADLAARTADGTLTAGLPDLSPLAALAGQKLSGRGEGRVVLSTRRGGQRVELDATLRELDRPGAGQGARRIALSGSISDAVTKPTLDLRLSGSGLRASDMTLERLEATARGPLTAAALTVEAAGRRAGQPLTLSGAATLGQDADATRIALERLSADLGGTPLRLTKPAVLAFGDGSLRVDGLALASADARIALEADLGPRRFQADARLRSVPLALLQLADPTLTVDGSLDGTLTLGGSPADPTGNLRLTIARFRVAPAEQTVIAPVDIRITGDWRGGRARLTAETDSKAGTADLTARADLPLVLAAAPLSFAVPADRPVSGSLEGTLELSQLNDLLAASGDRIAGRLTADLDLTGTAGDTALAGTASIAGGRYENQTLGTVVQEIQGTLVGDPDGLRVRDLQGRTPNGGRIELSGAVRLDPAFGDRQIDLRLLADRARVAQTDLVRADADADLTLRGSFVQALLSGGVRIRQANVSIPDRLPRQVVDLEIQEVNSPGAEEIARSMRVPGHKPPGGRSAPDRAGLDRPAAPAGDAPPPPTAVAETAPEPPAPDTGIRINLDLDVQAPNEIYIQGRGVDAEFKADLDVRGSTDEPLVVGAITLLKGQADVLGQTFALSRGVLTFTGDGSLEPRLDLEARAERGNLTAIIAVSGTPSKPAVKLTSEPALPEDEVLARLLFDRGLGDLSALEAVQLAQSAAQLTGVLGSGPGVLDDFRRSLGVDRLELRGSETGEGLGTVAAGRYIGDEVYLGVEQDLGTGESRATVEYDVTEAIRLRGEVGRESKVGVQFQWDY
ncbi:translocation/assembly module TamB domain-containing protein [Rhodospirillum centenum]|uniref:Translocation and assembly module TamB C-terminal domain-containing protein n=1 Tax=Rhodospirillum centenum (strain ATCC 51521 / SW) TaxID=414684 RepID=B6IY93_RHOCS|nr:translocation/assembly module TamB domain-containing protein [Rhodospirillum centenum]ACJ01267.1 conserved hypothetical protein [Rhodospirillum centenum SW]